MCDLVWREVVALCLVFVCYKQSKQVTLHCYSRFLGRWEKVVVVVGGMVLEKSVPSPAKAASLHLD